MIMQNIFGVTTYSVNVKSKKKFKNRNNIFYLEEETNKRCSCNNGLLALLNSIFFKRTRIRVNFNLSDFFLE